MDYYKRKIVAITSLASRIYGSFSGEFWVSIPTGATDRSYSILGLAWDLDGDLQENKVLELCKKVKWEF